VSSLTDFCDNKIGDHTGEHPLLFFCFLFSFSFLAFGQFYSLSFWVIHLDSLVLKVH
jgi:hypothetical protein